MVLTRTLGYNYITMQLFNHDLLKSKDKTAYALAKQLNLTDTSMYAIVSGKHVPRLGVARALASALDMPLDELQFVGELTKNV